MCQFWKSPLGKKFCINSINCAFNEEYNFTFEKEKNFVFFIIGIKTKKTKPAKKTKKIIKLMSTIERETINNNADVNATNPFEILLITVWYPWHSLINKFVWSPISLS